MANLVAPVSSMQPLEERIIEFRGLNRKSFVDEGEMSDMKNLTSDNYPLLCPRKLRGQLTLPSNVVKPMKIMTKFERIAMLAKKTDNTYGFFYRGTAESPIVYNDTTYTDWVEITEVLSLTSKTEMVAINTKICFFSPIDGRLVKGYIQVFRYGDSVTIGNFGYLEKIVRTTEGTYLSVSIDSDKATVTIPSTLGEGYAADDAIDIKGWLHYTTSGGESKTAKCEVSCIIESISRNESDGYVLQLPRETLIELTGQGATDITLRGEGSGTSYVPAEVTRTMPDIHHVIEWNNRLWGASDEDNTIYACKLGDPTNWKYFQGTSLDSYYAQQGSDENFTGCAAYSAHLIFFKPNSMIKVYGTSPSTFQVNNTVCYGVEPGSEKSVAIVNDTVFYKSSIGIMAYDGGTPYGISDRFNVKFSDAVGGTEGRKYYSSFKNEDGDYELMVLDVDKGLWHKEDDVRFRSCCTLDGRLYFIEDVDTDDFEKDKVYIINPETATETKLQRDWMATFGAFDELVEDRKIYSRMSLRFIAQPGTRLAIYIKMDDGEWELVKKFVYAGTGGETVPIVPRRCDRFSIKVVGTGDCEIKSLTRRFRRGSGVK